MSSKKRRVSGKGREMEIRQILTQMEKNAKFERKRYVLDIFLSVLTILVLAGAAWYAGEKISDINFIISETNITTQNVSIEVKDDTIYIGPGNKLCLKNEDGSIAGCISIEGEYLVIGEPKN